MLAWSCSESSASPAQAPSNPAQGELATAVFAGGCFWCVEEAFDKVPGVVETTSGYTGGTVRNPSYKQVSAGGTGHYEAVRVRYRPSQVSYARLLDTYWRNVDPFDAGGQFCDRGESYRSGLFTTTPEQRRLALESKAKVAARFNKAVATPVAPAATFYPAEGYHQDYHQRNNAKYNFYKWRCGRAQRLAEVWGKGSGA
jgi:peptide-methionine (S)-S-oxide reductase